MFVLTAVDYVIFVQGKPQSQPHSSVPSYYAFEDISFQKNFYFLKNFNLNVTLFIVIS